MKYLALGDSYTIGEMVAYADNFPSQTVQLLQEKGIEMKLEQLIAVTGWTTDELDAAIIEASPQEDFDWVSLLIGVNNQYRGRSLVEYEQQFCVLLQKAIGFAKGNASHVIVLSIPDWGLTPFNKEKDKMMVSQEINALNQINQRHAEELGCAYLDITSSTREHAEDPYFLAEDLLHYSKQEYGIWAGKMAHKIMEILEL